VVPVPDLESSECDIHTYNTHTYIHRTHTCIHTCIHTDIHTCMHTYTHAYIHAYMHTTYIHACMHTYIHTHVYPFSVTIMSTHVCSCGCAQITCGFSSAHFNTAQFSLHQAPFTTSSAFGLHTGIKLLAVKEPHEPSDLRTSSTPKRGWKTIGQ
jgi:hypothetical protein